MQNTESGEIGCMFTILTQSAVSVTSYKLQTRNLSEAVKPLRCGCNGLCDRGARYVSLRTLIFKDVMCTAQS